MSTGLRIRVQRRTGFLGGWGLRQALRRLAELRPDAETGDPPPTQPKEPLPPGPYISPPGTRAGSEGCTPNFFESCGGCENFFGGWCSGRRMWVDRMGARGTESGEIGEGE